MNTKYNLSNKNENIEDDTNKILGRSCIIINESFENISNTIKETTIIDDTIIYINQLYNNVSNKISFIINGESMESDK